MTVRQLLAVAALTVFWVAAVVSGFLVGLAAGFAALAGASLVVSLVVGYEPSPPTTRIRRARGDR